MALPLNKRDFDIFLSHAHKDHRFVSMLDRWLTDCAGFSVWYDARELGGGSLLATDLQAAIERCRGILLVASDEALKQGWVKKEYNSAVDESANHDGFRIVALRLGNADVTGLMRGITWIDVPQNLLDADAAAAILRAFYPGDRSPNPVTARDVYVSCSWRPDDSVSARAVSCALVGQGFRLVGDTRDQKGFGTGDRVERIIESCGAFVGILPFRDAETARAGEKPYKYFLHEMDHAAAQGIPRVIVADPRISRADAPEGEWLRMGTSETECPVSVASALEGLWAEWRRPPKPQYVFYATDLEADSARGTGPTRHLIERITGMSTIVGNEIHEQPLHSAIMNCVRDAFLVFADLTDDNVNACIEAGMGLVAGTNVELIARGEPRRPPFMLRALQMPTYKNDAEQLGIVHRLMRPYRRRIINAEL